MLMSVAQVPIGATVMPSAPTHKATTHAHVIQDLLATDSTVKVGQEIKVIASLALYLQHEQE